MAEIEENRMATTPLTPDEEAAIRRRAAMNRPFSALYRDLGRVLDALDAARARLEAAANDVEALEGWDGCGDVGCNWPDSVSRTEVLAILRR